MSAKGSGGKGKGKGKMLPGSGGKGKAYQATATRVTSSTKAGLHFPVARIRRLLKQTHEKRVTVSSATYLAAVLEYLMAELLELAGNCAREIGRKRITPRHILLAVKNDDELDRLLKSVIIIDGGVLPHIHPQLIPQLIPQLKGKKSGDSQEV
ncbi:histone-fold-containing protein [Mycena albidolilacea]|uniref:Histone H2A n=1 Tax=Mycena albidolilacea TaxID=1033008 RepID=A0AAD7ACW3_9AGAR|nr:histone-fold-containing protein [Mycena albidolilacea]